MRTISRSLWAAALLVGCVAAWAEAPASSPKEPAPAPPAYTSFYTGQIEAIGDKTLNLHVMRGHSGIVHPVNTDEKMQVVLASGKLGKRSDLAVGQWIKVYWNPDPDDAKQQRIVRVEPSVAPWVAKRLADLGKDAGALDVGVMFCIDGKGNVEELHFLGPDHPGGYKEPLAAVLSKEEMVVLLRFLASADFLYVSVEGTPPPQPPAPPYLALSVGKSCQYSPCGSAILKLLEGLSAVVNEKAAQKMDRLLAKVRPQVAAPPAPPAR